MVVGGPEGPMDKGEVPYFPRTQDPGRAIQEQERSWENFVPDSHRDETRTRPGRLAWHRDCGRSLEASNPISHKF